MKRKIISIVMCIMLALGACLMTACSEFDGKYTEVTAEEITLFANSIEKGSEEVDYNDMGVKMELKLDVVGGSEEMSMSAEMKSALVDNKIQAAMNMDLNSSESSGSVNMYFVDEYLYMDYDVTADGKQEADKMKIPMISFDMSELQNLAGMLGGAGTSSLPVDTTLAEAIDEVADYTGVVFYMDKSDKDYTKIKISIPEGTNEGYFGDIYFLFNMNNQLCGVKYDVTISITSGGETVTTTMMMAVEPYDGKVKMPKNFDEYKSLGLEGLL